MQRVRVGMTGLALVLVLIGLASALFTSASRDEPVAAIGASNAAVVANITDGNSVAADKGNEPLAELGVAPGTATTAGTNDADTTKKPHEVVQQK